MRWFRSTLEGAGLARHRPIHVLGILIVSAVLLGWLASSFFKITALGVFVALGALAFGLEAISALAFSRRRNLVKLWPEVIDSIYSAISSGLSIPDAIDDLALRGPLRLRASFLRLSTRLDTGWSFDSALDELKSELGEAHADRLCEVLRLASALGSDSLARTLKRQAQDLRQEFSVIGQIEAKQGWVLGTAKIATAAPWIVVAMLSIRAENAHAYNSIPGATTLLFGFLVSLFAYRLVQTLGSLPSVPRVFQ